MDDVLAEQPLPHLKRIKPSRGDTGHESDGSTGDRRVADVVRADHVVPVKRQRDNLPTTHPKTAPLAPR